MATIQELLTNRAKLLLDDQKDSHEGGCDQEENA